MAEPVDRTVRVVVADDQTVVRDGVCLMLGLAAGIEVVGTAADGAEAVAVVSATDPDVLLVDLKMPGVDGVEATRRVRALEHPPAGAGLTTVDDEAGGRGALGAGALGSLRRAAAGAAIADAVRSPAAGRSLLDAGVQARLGAAAGGGEPTAADSGGAGETAGLTPREVD